ncbi:hypothetical protein NP493_615g02076 [Ridgeia piscesae]|uniref:Uncharacterized protein n=1 Tax=Ridgeia piscesae TaxID=27915 RepID=A0AAD9NP36_RIDPI|nr:hypothetical protein NP493_615g02076 [Ridgeia piscesae]
MRHAQTDIVLDPVIPKSLEQQQQGSRLLSVQSKETPAPESSPDDPRVPVTTLSETLHPTTEPIGDFPLSQAARYIPVFGRKSSSSGSQTTAVFGDYDEEKNEDKGWMNDDTSQHKERPMSEEAKYRERANRIDQVNPDRVVDKPCVLCPLVEAEPAEEMEPAVPEDRALDCHKTTETKCQSAGDSQNIVGANDNVTFINAQPGSVLKEKPELVQEKPEPDQEKPEPDQEKPEPDQEKHKTEQERNETIQKKPLAEQKKPEQVEKMLDMVQENSELVTGESEQVQDKLEDAHNIPEPIPENAELVQDMPEIVQENMELIHDKPEPVHEKLEPVQNNPEFLQKVEKVQEQLEIALTKPEAIQENSEQVTENLELTQEKRGTIQEKLMLLEDNTEQVQENPELVQKKNETVREELVHGTSKPAPEKMEPTLNKPETTKEKLRTVQEHPDTIQENPETVQKKPQTVQKKPETSRSKPELVQEKPEPVCENVESVDVPELVQPVQENLSADCNEETLNVISSKSHQLRVLGRRSLDEDLGKAGGKWEEDIVDMFPTSTAVSLPRAPLSSSVSLAMMSRGRSEGVVDSSKTASVAGPGEVTLEPKGCIDDTSELTDSQLCQFIDDDIPKMLIQRCRDIEQLKRLRQQRIRRS